MGLSEFRALAFVAALLNGCGLGIRGIERPSYAERVEAEKHAAAERARKARARRHCENDTTRRVLDERDKHQRAKRALKAASERLRVAEELGDAPTIVQAMKDRDGADEAVRRTWWPTDANQKELTESCVSGYLKAGQ